MTNAHCRFPTNNGPSARPVEVDGERCVEHRELDAVTAAAEVAQELRQRARAQRRRHQPGQAGRDDADPDVPISDAQIAAVAECLNRHGVDYVLVGGAASQLHGANTPRTRDADIVPSKQADNLDRLAMALNEMEARLWVGPEQPEGLAMTFDRGTLGQIQGFLNLVTKHGPVDITYRPDGTDGFPDLARATVTVHLLGVDVPVAALEDVIRSKEAAGRAKDLAVLPRLIQHLRDRERPAPD